MLTARIELPARKLFHWQVDRSLRSEAALWAFSFRAYLLGGGLSGDLPVEKQINSFLPKTLTQEYCVVDPVINLRGTT